MVLNLWWKKYISWTSFQTHSNHYTNCASSYFLFTTRISSEIDSGFSQWLPCSGWQTPTVSSRRSGLRGGCLGGVYSNSLWWTVTIPGFAVLVHTIVPQMGRPVAFPTWSRLSERQQSLVDCECIFSYTISVTYKIKMRGRQSHLPCPIRGGRQSSQTGLGRNWRFR